MHRFVKILLGLLVLLLVLVVAAPYFLPMDRIKGVVVAKLEAATGRKVTLDTLTLSFLPRVGFTASNATLSNPDGMAGNFAQIKRMELGVELLPLLHREIHITRLTLDEPVIALARQGANVNWRMTPSQPAIAATDTNPAASSPKGMGATFSIDRLVIKNGTASYNDSVSAAKTITDLDLTLKAPNPAEKISLDGSAVVDGKKMSVNFTLGTPLARAGIPSDVDLKFSNGNISLAWQGTISRGNSVPAITGTLTIPVLDTRRPDEPATRKEAQSAAGAVAASGEPAPRWSDKPFALDSLDRATVNVTVNIGKLVLAKTTFENIQAHVTLANGTLTLTTEDIAAYGGTVRLAGAATATHAVHFAVEIAHVQAGPLLHDFAGFDRLTGTLDGKVDLAGDQATSEHSLIQHLGGNGDFHFSNGKLTGVNLGALAKNALSAATNSDAEHTDFTELSGSFRMASGVATNHDLKLTSPLVHVTGDGTVDLPGWQVHYLLNPSLALASAAPGITVPVHVDGPLDKPKYHADLAGAIQENLKNPQAVKENLKQLKQNLLQSGKLKGLLR